MFIYGYTVVLAVGNLARKNAEMRLFYVQHFSRYDLWNSAVHIYIFNVEFTRDVKTFGYFQKYSWKLLLQALYVV